MKRSLLPVVVLFLVAAAPYSWQVACAEHQGKLQILLLGDSTTIGSVCRVTDPKGPHLEDVIRGFKRNWRTGRIC